MRGTWHVHLNDSFITAVSFCQSEKRVPATCELLRVNDITVETLVFVPVDNI